MDKAYERFREWRRMTADDPEMQRALSGMDSREILDSFSRDLSFGTGGLRGVMGAGTYRMNRYTVARATRGLAGWVKKQGGRAASVAVAYDTRLLSDRFARVTAAELAAAGVTVWLFEEPVPTPCLSFAVRHLRCTAGVVITASHNPSKYNGYKVYDSAGCQITDGAAKEIFAEIAEAPLFTDHAADPDRLPADGRVRMIGEDTMTAYINAVREQSFLDRGADRSLSIVYTPLNGTGRKPVLRVLRETGFTNVTVVKEQEEPDGHFPTCPKPNPEVREAMELGIRTCREVNADLLIATDPDCDRCGIAVKDADGSYRLLSANETGLLLLDYIGSERKKNGTMPEHPVFMKTIVTTELAERVAAGYGMETVNVLTGFKYIGEKIGELERDGRADDFVFGFEESYGYLAGSYVRDKDGVVAVLLICEMFAACRAAGVSLPEKLEEIYRRCGYCLCTQHSEELEGEEGIRQREAFMEDLRRDPRNLAGFAVSEMRDYRKGMGGLPPSNVLRFVLEDGTCAVVRPSGTEPKLKLYYFVMADNREEAVRMEERLHRAVMGKFHGEETGLEQ